LGLNRFQEIPKGVQKGTDIITDEAFVMKNEIELKPMRAIILELE